jgi:hypothetical protein
MKNTFLRFLFACAAWLTVVLIFVLLPLGFNVYDSYPAFSVNIFFLLCLPFFAGGSVFQAIFRGKLRAVGFLSFFIVPILLLWFAVGLPNGLHGFEFLVIAALTLSIGSSTFLGAYAYRRFG